MPAYRRKANVDKNQGEIVDQLRSIPGVQVELEHDDILVGFKGRTYWFELKSDRAVSRKTGKVHESEKKDKQRKLEENWPGHYRIVSRLEEILEDIGLQRTVTDNNC